MNKFRERAQEIKAAGVAARGDFEPRADSVPVKVYKYWATYARRVPARENFCHYWRVVLFWAPFMWTRHRIVDVFTNKYFIGSLLAGLTAVAVWSMMTFNVVLDVVWTTAFFAALVYVGVGILVAGILFTEDQPIYYKKSDSESNGPEQWMTWTTLPVSLPVLGIIHGVYSICRFLNPHVSIMLKVAFILFFSFALLSFTYAMYMLSQDIGWDLLYWASGLVTAIALVAFTGFKVSDYLSGIRAEKDRLETERLSKYYSGDISYDEMYGQGKLKKKSRVGKFFSGIGDVIIFAAQVVRVKKWKICPLVTIPEDS